jgi:hypothetical protein
LLKKKEKKIGGREEGEWAGGWSLGQAGPRDGEGRKGKKGLGFLLLFFFYFFFSTHNKQNKSN